MALENRESSEHNAPTGPLPVMCAIETSKFGDRVTYEFIDVEQFVDTAVGGRAKGIRRTRGWSRHTLAKRAGVETSEVELFERQPWAVPIRVISAITQALGVSPMDLSEGTSKIYSDRLDG